MPLIINTNVGSLNSQRYLTRNTNTLAKSMEKLSSGFRINKAADDAAGLQLSEQVRTQIRGSQKASDNTQDGINVLNITDGALQQVTDNLQRMRELAVQAGNDTYSATQKGAIKAEMDQLSADITRIANATQFNGKTLLNGSQTTFTLQIGANNNATNDQLNIASAFADISVGVNGLNIGTVDVVTNATAAITSLDTALDKINTQRGTIGAFVTRLEGASNNLTIALENFSASESRIRNVDVAAESSNLTRNQILQQASQAMLSQANQAPQLAIQLLRG